MVYNYCRVFGNFLLVAGGFFFFVSVFLLGGSGYYINWGLFSLGSCEISMTIVIDWMSMMFLSFVLLISCGVMFYSEGYMMGDEDKDRFCFVVFLFVLSMVFVIISPNLISILLGWDGLGLVSYWLVIYYQNYSSYSAGMLTILSNRIGDVCLLVAICLMVDWGGWEYEELSVWGGGSVAVFSLCVLAGMTSGAQIPFSAWLPAAMAAPTPVSSLVHSSTLVTAGVYLLVRFEGMMGGSCCFILMYFSCATMFMAGLGANYEFDLKSVVALSTLSQVGLMLFSLSLGLAHLAFFHLMCHAVFKCLLFLCAGSIIHSSLGWQDIRMMGGVFVSNPFISGCMGVANLALCGFPFLAGFYSSEMILEWMMMGDYGAFLVFIMVFSIGLTACYSVRLIYYLAVGEGYGYCGGSESDGDGWMNPPIFYMTVLSVVSGGVLSWFVFPSPGLVALPFLLSLSGVSLVVSGGWVGLLISGASGSSMWLLGGYLGSMWYLPNLSGEWVSYYYLVGGGSLIQTVDMGWGSVGVLSWAVSGFSTFVQWGHDNIMKLYMFTFFLWVWVVFWVV